MKLDENGNLKIKALMPPREVGGTVRNSRGESYMKFKIHPESSKTAPGPAGLNARSSDVTIQRSSIRGVRADKEDAEALMLETDLGPVHVTGVPVRSIHGRRFD